MSGPLVAVSIAKERARQAWSFSDARRQPVFPPRRRGEKVCSLQRQGPPRGGLKCKKIVRLAPADAKIGLQQIRAAKHEPNQLQAPPDSDAERQRRANKNDFRRPSSQSI